MRAGLRRLPILAALALAGGCATKDNSMDADRPDPLVKGLKTPPPVRAWERGADLVPADALEKWLDAQVDARGQKRLVRLPITLVREDALSVTASVGDLKLKVTDYALGIPLAERARLARKENEVRCTLMVNGFWEGRKHPAGWNFSAYEVGERVEEGSITYAQVEKASSK